jgi:peptidoglycan/LPS O-acetylase OafA/YrhL
MKYRAEIDGLRAVAVIPVILFHAGFELFSGGFVGVDVFFVISGYLITTILIEDIENQRFSLVNFYERRARRILPALFFVMFFCIPFAWMWMLPNQMKDFSQSLVAVSLFASNVLFWRESGYFDAAAEEKPLLHTWSLAVEEQYYVLFPIFLFLAWRYGKNRVFWMIVAMTSISFLFSEWGWRNKATGNFYLAPTRAWELFTGSIAAFIVQKNGVRKNNFLALLGLAAITFSIFAYDESTPFPSVYALVPVLGVVLLILYADKDTLTAKLLGTKVLVGIGLISYSAYLWHQPLFAFARIRSLEHPSLHLMLALSLLSIFLAYFSWRYIEKIFRGNLIRQKHIFLLSTVGVFTFITMGITGHKSNGFSDRSVFQSIRIYEETINQGASGFRHCKLNSYFIKGLDGKICLIGNLTQKPIGLLWGDSYAASALHGINNYLLSKEQSYIAILSNGCMPIPGISRDRNALNCSDTRQRNVLNWFLQQSELNELIWVGRFRSLSGNYSELSPFYIDGLEPNLRSLEAKIEQTTQALLDNNKRFVLVLDGPNFPVSIPAYLAKGSFLDADIDPDLTTVSVIEQRHKIGISLDSLNLIEGLRYIDSLRLFCETLMCDGMMKNGIPLVVDTGHISHSASDILAAETFRVLRD